MASQYKPFDETKGVKRALQAIDALDRLADTLPIDSLSRRKVVTARQDIEDLLEQSAGPIVTFQECFK